MVLLLPVESVEYVGYVSFVCVNNVCVASAACRGGEYGDSVGECATDFEVCSGSVCDEVDECVRVDEVVVHCFFVYWADELHVRFVACDVVCALSEYLDGVVG